MTALLSFVRPQKITAKIGGDFQLGGPERDRTVDLSDANRTLSQLSYRPELFWCLAIISPFPVFVKWVFHRRRWIFTRKAKQFAEMFIP